MQHSFAIVASMFVAYMVALWFALAMWTFNDVRARSQNIVTQLLATVLVLGAGPFDLLEPLATMADEIKPLERKLLYARLRARNDRRR